MLTYYHKSLLTQVASIVLLPMILLVLIATCDFTTIEINEGGWRMFVRRASAVLIVLWFFDIMLLVLTLAMKELVLGHFCYAMNEEQDPVEEQVLQQFPAFGETIAEK
ncbi:MAG: hypothetical protein LBJ67_17220 [Planctomycetaceae bacterium]|jgi:hypothetical protein|nr:hypothetical protein [Planctomycetaceae bacterium]